MFGSQIPDQIWYAILAGAGFFVALSWWGIKDAFGREFTNKPEKMIWIQVIILIPFLGPFIYLFFGRKRGQKSQ